MLAILSCRNRYVLRRAERCLRKLRWRYTVAVQPVSPAECRRRAIYVMDVPTAIELEPTPDPLVLLLTGAAVPDNALIRICVRRMCATAGDDLTPESLLDALTSAIVGSNGSFLRNRLQDGKYAGSCAPEVVNAFLVQPSKMCRLSDLRRVVPGLSRERARELVREQGFSRAEHLFTALRADALRVLSEAGLSRNAAEVYLGIHHRSAFRRACARARIDPPSIGVGRRQSAQPVVEGARELYRHASKGRRTSEGSSPP